MGVAMAMNATMHTVGLITGVRKPVGNMLMLLHLHLLGQATAAMA